MKNFIIGVLLIISIVSLSSASRHYEELQTLQIQYKALLTRTMTGQQVTDDYMLLND